MRDWIETADATAPLDLVVANAGISGGTGGLRHGEPEAQARAIRSEEHTSELQSLMRISYAVFCLKKKIQTTSRHRYTTYAILLPVIYTAIIHLLITSDD